MSNKKFEIHKFDLPELYELGLQLTKNDVKFEDVKTKSVNASYSVELYRLKDKWAKLPAIDVKNLNCKISVPKMREGKYSMLRASFFVEDAIFNMVDKRTNTSVEINLGKFITHINNITLEALNYQGKIVSLVQTKIMEGEGLKKITKLLDKPLCWVLLNCSEIEINGERGKFNDLKKIKYNGQIEFIEVVEGSTRPNRFKVQKPSIAKIQQHWIQRAMVTGKITLENICVKGDECFIRFSFWPYATLYVQPISIKMDESNTVTDEECMEIAETVGYTQVENTNQNFAPDDLPDGTERD